MACPLGVFENADAEPAKIVDPENRLPPLRVWPTGVLEDAELAKTADPELLETRLLKRLLELLRQREFLEQKIICTFC